jgi:hypothetical protein
MPISVSLILRKFDALTAAHLERKNIIREDNDLVPSAFMIMYQILTSLELVRIECVEENTFSGFGAKVLGVEFGCHRAPYFGALRYEL